MHTSSSDAHCLTISYSCTLNESNSLRWDFTHTFTATHIDLTILPLLFFKGFFFGSIRLSLDMEVMQPNWLTDAHFELFEGDLMSLMRPNEIKKVEMIHV